VIVCDISLIERICALIVYSLFISIGSLVIWLSKWEDCEPINTSNVYVCLKPGFMSSIACF